MLKKSKIIKVITFLSCLCAFSSCNAQKLKTTTLSVKNSDNKQIPIIVEIAKTENERSLGFMNRKKIPEGTGMIFVYNADQVLSFWMKNTPTALSIAFIDKNGLIRDIFDMTPFSLNLVVSTTSVRYALEVPQGWFKKNQIKEGDTVSGLLF